MTCPHCGAAVEPDATHCPNCGTDLAAPVAVGVPARPSIFVSLLLGIAGMLLGIIVFLVFLLSSATLSSWPAGLAATRWPSKLPIAIEEALFAAALIAAIAGSIFLFKQHRRGRIRPELQPLLIGTALTLLGGLSVCNALWLTELFRL